MTLECAKGFFDLPIDFTIDVKMTNPILSDVGDMSAPITLPPTPNNLALAGNSFRLDALLKPITDIEVIINDGVFSEKGKLSIDSVSRTNGVSGTVFFGLASFYSEIDTRMLNSINLPDDLFETSGDLNTKRMQIVNTCTQEVRTPSESAPYRIAMVNTDIPIKWIEDGVEAERSLLLNELEHDVSNLRYLKARADRQYKEGSSIVTVRTSYGVSPQLKLSYVLMQMFSTFGVVLDETSIKEYTVDYHSWVIVNNIADAVYAGKCSPKQLLPDVSIKEFIAYIELFLNGKFVVDDVEKRASFVFFDDVILANPDLDLSEFVRSEPDITETKFVEIVINEMEAQSDNIRKIDIFIPGTKDLFADRLTVSDTLCLPGVSHPNSEVRIQGKANTKEEKKSGGSDIILGVVRNLSPDPYRSRIFSIIDRVCNFPRKSYGNPIEHLVARYDHRRTWEMNSNIAVSVEMDIPISALSRFSSYMPKSMLGQTYFLETIDRVIGMPKLMKVKLRTIRNYL